MKILNALLLTAAAFSMLVSASPVAEATDAKEVLQRKDDGGDEGHDKRGYDDDWDHYKRGYDDDEDWDHYKRGYGGD
ncbi:hypothetical protein A0J61_08238, partial [Choanephora cucurbitarum]